MNYKIINRIKCKNEYSSACRVNNNANSISPQHEFDVE